MARRRWHTALMGMLLVGGLATPGHTEPTRAIEWAVRYDDAGRLAGVVDPAGQATTLHYTLDEDNQVRQVTRALVDGSRVRVAFDVHGRRMSMTDAGGTVRYAFDGFDRLLAVRREGLPDLRYTYDSLGRLSGMTLGDEHTARYDYDFLGRPAAITLPGGTITYAYRPRTIIRTLPNGIRTILESNPDGSLRAIHHVAPDQTIVAQFTYTYRPDGLISALSEVSPQGERRLTYGYDTAQRLITVREAQQDAFTYRWDPLGNLLEATTPGQPPVTSAFDALGRMRRHAGHATTHDSRGNLTQYTNTQGTVTYTYTAAYTLATVQRHESRLAYIWDGDGRLIARQDGTTTARFLPDARQEGWRPVLAQYPDGTQERYVWEEDALIAVITSDATLFFLYDHQSVRLVTDQRGRVVRSYDYTPLGALVGVPEHNTEKGRLRPAFAGWFLDLDAGLYLTRAGAYDPHLGRWLQPGRQLYTTLLRLPGSETGQGRMENAHRSAP